MEFTSVEQIQNEFDLKGMDKEDIVLNLKQMLKDSHPDKLKDSSFDSEKFEKIKNALEFMEKKGTEVVPVKCVTDLVEVLKDLAIKNQEKDAERQLNECLDRNYKKQKEALVVPKVSLSAVTGALGFLWFFPQYVLEHPIMSKLIVNNVEFSALWISAMICVGFLWMQVFKNERRNKYLLDFLKTESTQNNLLMNFYSCAEKRSFAKSDLADYILDEFNHYHSFNYHGGVIHLLNKVIPIFRSGIDRETAECIADSIIDRAEKKKMILYKTDDHSFVDHYEWLLPKKDCHQDE